MKKQSILKSLRAAEKFIAGFEDDETQEGIDKLLSKIRKSIRDVEDVDSHPISILDLNKLVAPESFIRKIEDAELQEYIDTCENLAEDLYSCEIREKGKEAGIKWSKTEDKYLKEIEKMMVDRDCSYFRFVIN